MSQVNLNDDFFSPIRLNASTVDSSDISEGSLSELLNRHVRLSLSDSPKNDKVFEEENSKHDEKELKDEKFKTQNVVPVTNKSSKNSLNSGKLDKMQLLKKRETKHSSKKEDSGSSQQAKDSLTQEVRPNSQNYKSSSSKSSHMNKTSRPTSLFPSKEEVTKNKTLKDLKKKQKISQASKGIDSITDVHGTDNKNISEKKVRDSSLHSDKNTKNLKSEDCLVKSIESNEKFSTCKSTHEQLIDSSKQRQLGLISNPGPSQYQESVEKIIQDCISSETAKIRQSMYLQQMNFYREMHKIKHEMELQHSETNDRLFGIVKELANMNATLKSILIDKNQ